MTIAIREQGSEGMEQDQMVKRGPRKPLLLLHNRSPLSDSMPSSIPNSQILDSTPPSRPLRVGQIKRERETTPRLCRLDLPRGAAKCNTFPSSLNMLTSSTFPTAVTFNFLRAAWSFLSSPWEAAWDFLTTLRRGVPLPPVLSRRRSEASEV
jgi:hypothetical protein